MFGYEVTHEAAEVSTQKGSEVSKTLKLFRGRLLLLFIPNKVAHGFQVLRVVSIVNMINIP